MGRVASWMYIAVLMSAIINPGDADWSGDSEDAGQQQAQAAYLSALQRGDKDAAYGILLWQKSLIEAESAALRKVDAEALDIDHLPAALVDMPVLECECTQYSDIDINASSCREGGEVYILASVRQLSPWIVYELEIKWSFERDKLTHTEFMTQTWKSVANAVKGSYTLREPLVQPWRKDDFHFGMMVWDEYKKGRDRFFIEVTLRDMYPGLTTEESLLGRRHVDSSVSALRVHCTDLRFGESAKVLDAKREVDPSSHELVPDSLDENRNCWPGDKHCNEDANLHPSLVRFRARDCGANFSRDVRRGKEENTLPSAFDVPVSELKDLSYFLRPSYQVFGCELPGVPIDGGGMIRLSDTITRIKIDVGLADRAPNTQLWLDNIPGLVVFGFEPNLQSVSDMLAGRSRNRGLSKVTEPYLDQKYVGSQMFLFPVALGSSRGQEDFYATKNPACSSLLEPDVKKILDFGAGAECGESEMYPVAVLTLSDLLSKIPWGSEVDPGVFPIVEHIKTDTQGYDLAVLKGAGRYLSERVVCVTAEKFVSGYIETGNSEEELIDFMYHEGFVLFNNSEIELTFYNDDLFDWWEEVDCLRGEKFVATWKEEGQVSFPSRTHMIVNHTDQIQPTLGHNVQEEPCPARTTQPNLTSPSEGTDTVYLAPPSDKARVSRTAVCVSGQLRTLNMGPGHPYWPPHNEFSGMCHSGWPCAEYIDVARMKGRTVAGTIQRNLFGSLEDFDVFMTVSTRSSSREPKVNDSSACESLRPMRPGSNLFCEVVEERDAPLFQDLEIWKTYSYQDKYLQQGLLQQLKGMHRCSVMIQQYVIQSGLKYDYVIRLRPDMAMYEPMAPISSLLSQRNVIKHVDFFVCAGGEQDWFGVGYYDSMIPYLQRYLALQTVGNELNLSFFDPIDNTPKTVWTAELFLVRYMKTYFNVTLEGDKRIPGCLVRPLSRRSPSDA